MAQPRLQQICSCAERPGCARMVPGTALRPTPGSPNRPRAAGALTVQLEDGTSASLRRRIPSSGIIFARSKKDSYRYARNRRGWRVPLEPAAEKKAGLAITDEFGRRREFRHRKPPRPIRSTATRVSLAAAQTLHRIVGGQWLHPALRTIAATAPGRKKDRHAHQMGGNEDGRSNGERLAIDPNSDQCSLLGSRKNGLWKEHGLGASWDKSAASRPLTVATEPASPSSSSTSRAEPKASPRRPSMPGVANKEAASFSQHRCGETGSWCPSSLWA